MERLNDIFKKVNNIDHAIAMLSWDEAVNMSSCGASARAESIKELSLISHQYLSDPRLPDLFLEIAAEIKTRPAQEQAHFKEMQRSYQNQIALPAEFISRKILATSKCEQEWRHYRKENNWKDFLPYFEDVLAITIEEASIRSEKTGLSKYDALLNLYEPDTSSKEIDILFSDLIEFLPNFLKEVIQQQEKSQIIASDGKFPIDIQKVVGLNFMKTLGFDFKKGCLDVSHHPFCGGVSSDVRLTTRYEETNFTESLMGIIHETGHGLYEQNLPELWNMYPVGKAKSMGIHESQSLFYEMQIGRSNAFINHSSNLLEKYYGSYQKDKSFWTVENLKAYFHKVERGLIRTSADEVTYPLHIILRYDLEKRMIEGRLEAKDLPEAWNINMKNYFDLDTTNNFRDGCMQDVHWYSGAFGYFPSYTLGAINAAQLYNTLEKNIPEVGTEISTGNLDSVNQFLKKTIWKNASFFSTSDLITSATGEEMNSKYYKDHLHKRYILGEK